MSGDVQVRFCERLGVRFPRATYRVVTCTSAAEARSAIAAALRILSELDVQLHPQKTRVVHVQRGFEFLGYLVRRGKRLRLPPGRIVTGAKSGDCMLIPEGNQSSALRIGCASVPDAVYRSRPRI